MGYTPNFGLEEILSGTINWEVIYNTNLASIDTELGKAQAKFTDNLYVSPIETIVESGIATLDVTNNHAPRRRFNSLSLNGVACSFLLPEVMVAGASIEFKLHWAPNSGAAGNVEWNLGGSVLQTGGVVGAVEWTLSKVSAAPGVADEVVVSTIGEVLPSTYGGDQSTVVSLYVRRNAPSGSDTLGAEAELLMIEIETKLKPVQ